MNNSPLTQDQMQRAMNAVHKHGTKVEAAKALGITRNQLNNWFDAATSKGLVSSDHSRVENVMSPEYLARKIKTLEMALRDSEKQRIDHEIIKRKILEISANVTDAPIPKWLFEEKSGHDFPGVPSLMLSDLHFGETVDPSQVGGVNQYNMEIAKSRLEAVGEGAIRLLGILSPKFDYPGMVLNLGGDIVNGNIREEMTATNEENIMPVCVALFEQLGSLIMTMADRFKRVFIPCVCGNHGRATMKTWSSDRHATSFEWLLYNLLAKRFADDERITFLIPNGVDARYKIYNHRFLLNHGDAFRGGDGVIGVLGPVIRGDYKKRSRNAQINQEYDTMIIGHFHQYVHLNKLIINSSLVGYNEYAYINNFPYERPSQALFLTHPKYGITFRMPVYADKKEPKRTSRWVSIGGMAA